MIDLPYPAKALWPNGRAHFMTKARPGAWTDEELEMLRTMRGQPSKTISAAIGRSPAAIRNKLYELGWTAPNLWPDALLVELRELYEAAGPDGVVDLATFAQKWGRPKANLCRKARELGLTNIRRRKVEERKDRRKFKTVEALRHAQSELAKQRIAKNGHPRGMAGKKHSAATSGLLSQRGKARFASMTTAEREDYATKRLAAALKKNGYIGAPPETRKASWKAGWREIGGKRNYYRSRWEANYARYLQWLKDRGDIADWQHEPETFWFEAIRRGVRSYLPDFRVWENDGSAKLHEVKGWMDARSKTTLKRMAKYHPHETIILVREKDYNAIARAAASLIEGWEQSNRADRL